MVPELKSGKRLVALLYKGRLQGVDRAVDIGFWQSQGPKAILDAAWELVEDAWRWKHRDLNELRLQRTVIHIQHGRS